jgi:hypothetical protein
MVSKANLGRMNFLSQPTAHPLASRCRGMLAQIESEISGEKAEIAEKSALQQRPGLIRLLLDDPRDRRFTPD